MKIAVRVTVFVLILGILLSAAADILAAPVAWSWAIGTGMELIHKYKNQYDACFFGTSMAIANLSHQELYEKYGIAGVTVAGGEQSMYLTRYMMEETAQYQDSAVFFLEMSSLFYDEQGDKDKAKDREDYIVHGALDGMRSLDIKRRALAQVNEYNGELDKWSYYSTLYYSHANWEDLTADHFRPYDDRVSMNGNIAILGVAEGFVDMYGPSDPDEVAPVNEAAAQAVRDMADLCRETGHDLILLTSRVNCTRASHRAIAELAEECGVEYIDINEHIEEVGFDYALDLADGGHFNLSGAVKWSDFLGQYIKDNYDVADRRGTSGYERYERQSETFHMQKRVMDTVAGLLYATTFDDYLAELNRLDDDKFTILISVYDESSSQLSETSCLLLNRLGLKKDLRGCFRWSYAAIIGGGDIQEAFKPDKTVTLSRRTEGAEFEVKSGGLSSGGDASILINEEECIQKGRGFNFVVYSGVCPVFCVNTAKERIERDLKGNGGKPFPLASY